jgi:serine protease DegS
MRKSSLLMLLTSAIAGLLAALVTYWWIGSVSSAPRSYADAVASAAPSVVNVYTTKLIRERQRTLFDDPLFQHFFGDRFRSPVRERRQTSLGSGVIIDGEGHILTNNHVIEDADEIRVVLLDGRTLEAEVVGRDPDTDLALMAVAEKALPHIDLAKADRLRVGDVVLAIGNPFGVGQTVTMGIVSATGRDHLGLSTFENFIQTDAAINPGNSGGALINPDGDLVGINTAIFSQSGGSMGIGFAIPISIAEGVMAQLLEHGRVVRGWLGLAGQDLTPDLAHAFGLKNTSGVLISSVLRNGPADLAGLEPGDVILSINGELPRNSAEILRMIANLAPGSQVEIAGIRGTQRFSFQAEVAERPRLVE